MSEEPTKQPDRVTISAEEQTTAVSFGRDGQAQTTDTIMGDSLKTEFDGDGKALSDDELKELEGDLEDDDQTAKEPEGETDDKAPEGDDSEDTKDPEGGEELPEWDPESEEVTSAYDAKYITKDEDGADVLNFKAFNDEFAKDRGEGKRDLNPGTRKFLKERFGISDKLIDSHLAGVIAQERVFADTFHLNFGATPEEGEKAFGEMFSWAKEEYTPAQRARYNAAMQEGGDAAQEQIELLKTRFLTKNPGAGAKKEEPTAKPRIGLQARSSGPARSATSKATSEGQTVKPFANAEEHRMAQNAALKLSGAEGEKALSDVRKRLQASTFWRS